MGLIRLCWKPTGDTALALRPVFHPPDWRGSNGVESSRTRTSGAAARRGGQKETKQHKIDDFVACARYMIARGYTSRAHVAVRGTSAGGIAVGGFVT